MGVWLGDSQSQFAMESSSHQGDQETEEGQAEAEDASVRALRPRSSRRNSWDSEVSRWSARVLLGRERSLRTNSFRVGDGDGSELGEDCDSPDVLKGPPGPSPLVDNVISTGITEAGDREEGSKAHVDTVQESTEELDSLTSLSRQTTTGEPERTPTKKVTVMSNDLDLENDLTAKIPFSIGKEPVEIRRPSGEAEAEA